MSDDEKIAELKAKCLAQTKSVTGLKGKKLNVVIRKSSANEGEWYCALKSQDDNKYPKHWMAREKTFASQIEALEAYLLFVKKRKSDCSLFPMSPRAHKTK